MLDTSDKDVLHYLTGKKFYDEQDVEDELAVARVLQDCDDDILYDKNDNYVDRPKPNFPIKS